uniref:Putative secreted protein n=1 Tax=Anopheles triannulatus TaxID=58253 RepID=A0A2M4B326_9DIPT
MMRSLSLLAVLPSSSHASFAAPHKHTHTQTHIYACAAGVCCINNITLRNEIMIQKKTSHSPDPQQTPGSTSRGPGPALVAALQLASFCSLDPLSCLRHS